MKIWHVLLASFLILGAAAGCGRGSGDSGTPIAFMPVTTPGPEPQAPAQPQATETLPPLPALDVPTAGPQTDVSVTRIEPQAGGGPVTVPGTLPPGGRTRYVLAGQAGQALVADLSLAQGLAILTVLGEDGQSVAGTQPRATHWSGPLPSVQDYTIEVTAVSGSTEVRYTLAVTLAPAP